MYIEPRKKPLGGLAVITLVFGGHAAVFAAISSRAPVEAQPEPEPMMVSLVADNESVKAGLRAELEPVREQPKPRKEAPAKRQPQPQPIAQPMPEPALLPVIAESTQSVPQAQPHQEVMAQVAPVPATLALAEPAGREAEPEPVYQLPRFGVAYLRNPSPEYPPISRRLREQGKVLLRVMVTTRGEPEAIELEKSSGFERLDQAAMEAVKQWRFVPAKRGDQAVSAWVVVPLNFSVKE